VLAYSAADELPARKLILLPVCRVVAIRLAYQDSSTGAPVCQKGKPGCELLLSQPPYSYTLSVLLFAEAGLQIPGQREDEDLLPCADAQIRVEADGGHSGQGLDRLFQNTPAGL
jgi:hypothetical protein